MKYKSKHCDCVIENKIMWSMYYGGFAAISRCKEHNYFKSKNVFFMNDKHLYEHYIPIKTFLCK